MSFSMNVKNEVSKLPLETACCQRSELAALVRMIGTIQIHGRGNFGMKMVTENASIARRIFSMIKNLYGLTVEVRMTKNTHLKKNNIYSLSLDETTCTEKWNTMEILKDCGILTERDGSLKINSSIGASITKKPCCKKAYLRGVFLGGGSVSDPEKNYHLELVTNHDKYAVSVQKMMKHFALNAKIVNRKNNYIVYLKEGEQIVDFLSIIGAYKALMDFENTRAKKDLRNNINRQVNCEAANYCKTYDAANRQIKNIEYIAKKVGFHTLPEGLVEIAQLRLEFPDATLKELGDMCGEPLGKSGVNHRLRKLDQIADKLREQLGEIEVDYE